MPRGIKAQVAQWVRYIVVGLPVVNYKKGCTRLAAAHDKVYQLLAHGRWFSPGTPASSTTKTGRHDITEILLKVTLKHKKLKSNPRGMKLFTWYLIQENIVALHVTFLLYLYHLEIVIQILLMPSKKLQLLQRYHTQTDYCILSYIKLINFCICQYFAESYVYLPLYTPVC
jgi:hypothetical protein